MRSRVDSNSPNLHRIVHHIGDQISIVNDLASYEMEKRRFESGKAKSLINIVSVIMNLERVGDAVAKSMAYAWQLCMENEILKDMDELKKKKEERKECNGLKAEKEEEKECNGLSAEKEDEEEEEEVWRFIDAWLLVASGNLFTSVVMSRYGGEGARVS